MEIIPVSREFLTYSLLQLPTFRLSERSPAGMTAARRLAHVRTHIYVSRFRPDFSSSFQLTLRNLRLFERECAACSRRVNQRSRCVSYMGETSTFREFPKRRNESAAATPHCPHSPLPTSTLDAFTSIHCENPISIAAAVRGRPELSNCFPV